MNRYKREKSKEEVRKQETSTDIRSNRLRITTLMMNSP